MKPEAVKHGYPARSSVGYVDDLNRRRQLQEAALTNHTTIDALEYYFATGQRAQSRCGVPLHSANDDEEGCGDVY